MTEKDELFGGINLMSQPQEIEILEPAEVVEREEAAAEVETKKPAKKVKEEVEEEDDDFTFDIPDIVENTDENKDVSEKPSSPPIENDASSPSLIEPFAKALYEEGILPNFNEDSFKERVKEIGEVEALFETIKTTIESEIESFKQEAEEDFKNFIKARDEGLDLNEYAKISASAKKYSSIKEDLLEDDEKLQKNIVKEYLRSKGFDDEEISDTIESYEDTAKLLTKSKAALKNLIKDEEAKAEKLKEDTKRFRIEQAEAIENQRKSLKKLIEETKNIIPDVSLTGNEKKRIFEHITTPIDKDANGNPINIIMKKRMENPLRYAMLEAYYNDIGLFDENFEKIIKKAKSNSIKDFTKAIESGAALKSPKGKPVVSTTPGIDPDFNDAWSRL